MPGSRSTDVDPVDVDPVDVDPVDVDPSPSQNPSCPQDDDSNISPAGKPSKPSPASTVCESPTDILNDLLNADDEFMPHPILCDHSRDSERCESCIPTNNDLWMHHPFRATCGHVVDSYSCRQCRWDWEFNRYDPADRREVRSWVRYPWFRHPFRERKPQSFFLPPPESPPEEATAGRGSAKKLEELYVAYEARAQLATITGPEEEEMTIKREDIWETFKQKFPKWEMTPEEVKEAYEEDAREVVERKKVHGPWCLPRPTNFTWHYLFLRWERNKEDRAKAAEWRGESSEVVTRIREEPTPGFKRVIGATVV